MILSQSIAVLPIRVNDLKLEMRLFVSSPENRLSGHELRETDPKLWNLTNRVGAGLSQQFRPSPSIGGRSKGHIPGQRGRPTSRGPAELGVFLGLPYSSGWEKGTVRVGAPFPLEKGQQPDWPTPRVLSTGEVASGTLKDAHPSAQTPLVPVLLQSLGFTGRKGMGAGKGAAPR